MAEIADLKGLIPESWCCVDCGVNTAPGLKSRADTEQALKSQALSASGNPMSVTPWSEVYRVRKIVWRKAGMEPMGGCLCVGCLEKRLGRPLRPKDFVRNHPLNQLPGTVRLMSRRDEQPFFIDHADGLYVVVGGKTTPVKTLEEGAEIIRMAKRDVTRGSVT
jgi:hypothetical protein